MPRFYDADPQELINKAAQELKKNNKITPPVWAAYVKTGTQKERPPTQNDWWYLRTASILKKVATLGPIGVSKLRTKYGGKKRRGHKPAVFKKGSGNILRKALQQLQSAGFIVYKKEGVHKGRIATKEGISFLDKVANTIIPKHQKKAKEQKEQVQQPQPESKTEIKEM